MFISTAFTHFPQPHPPPPPACSVCLGVCVRVCVLHIHVRSHSTCLSLPDLFTPYPVPEVHLCRHRWQIFFRFMSEQYSIVYTSFFSNPSPLGAPPRLAVRITSQWTWRGRDLAKPLSSDTRRKGRCWVAGVPPGCLHGGAPACSPPQVPRGLSPPHLASSHSCRLLSLG